MPLNGHASEKHRVIDWMKRLDLTHEQEDELDKIDAHYLEQFKNIQMSIRQEWGTVQDQEEAYEGAKALMNLTMDTRAQKRAVLNEKQLEQADALVRRFHMSMTERYLKKITRMVELSDEQKNSVTKGIEEIAARFDWPLVHEQADFARASSESLLSDILTDDQMETVMKEQIRMMRRWPSPPGDHDSRRPERRGGEDIRFEDRMRRGMGRDENQPPDENVSEGDHAWQSQWRQNRFSSQVQVTFF
ncbi:MAG: hypothetical protein ACPGYX_12930 [Oceanobacter sp.]